MWQRFCKIPSVCQGVRVPRPAPVLSVRSALLSVLLGCYPEAIAPGPLVVMGRHLGLGESALRAALSRGVAAGDLERTPQGYRIGTRQLARFEAQDEAVHTSSAGGWDGTWETAVVVGSGRSPADRAALRTLLGRHRLAELREGVWLRPANLPRPASYAAHADVRACESRHPDPAALAAELWDLEDWSATGERLVADLGAAGSHVERLTAAAVLVRHLRTDPLLPADLLPRDWPGARLRATYAAYQAELRALADVP